jgi:phosphoribosyl-ATP pyrophosphohydrolase
MPIMKNHGIVTPMNKAELSLSIKGEKQDASIVCLKIRNLREMKSKRGSPEETIEKIIDAAEDHKAVTYENQDYLFFILAPAKTRTFKNEITALNLAEKIQNMMAEHNRMFNQKMEFGISLNQGTIVGKPENGVFKFMAMGTWISAARKIASLAKGEILLSEKMNDLLRLNIRTDKSVREGVSVFSIKEIKRENEEAKKFIDKFMNRQGK